MKREKHPAVKTLKWFLDFLNAGLADAPEEEVLRRLFEVSLRLEWTPEGAEPVNVPAPEEVRERYTVNRGRKALQELQAGLREFLDSASKQKTVGMGIYGLSLVRNTLTGRWQIATKVPKLGKGSQVGTVWLPAAKATLALALHDLPEGLPRDCIKTCKECGKLFPHLSGKPKMYCNARCTSVNLSRKRRGEPGTKAREKYNRKMQEVMSEKYFEKVERKLGKGAAAKLRKKREERVRKG